MGQRGDLVVGIGAMRSGTTTLHNYLDSHPDVRVTRHKEAHYFDLNYDNGPEWYDEQFEPGPALWRADVTPSYMSETQACERIAAEASRVVVILRDPITRAFSHYLQKRSYGTEPLSFTAALDAEPARIRDLEEGRWLYGYLDRGNYLEYLTPYAEALGRDAIHVMILDDLMAEPDATWNGLCNFLAISPVAPSRHKPSNPYVEFRSQRLRTLTRRLPRPAARIVGRLNSRRRPPPAMDPRDVARLREHFGPGVDALSVWLDRDLRALWWGR